MAGFHRQSYGGCKAGIGDVLIGRQAPLDEYKEAAKALAGIDASSFRGAGGDMAPPHGLGA